MTDEPKIIDEQFDEQTMDKKEWAAKIMESHPEILKLAEQTRVLEGLKENASNPSTTSYALPSYSRTVSDARIFNPDALTEENVIALLCEYLKEENLIESRNMLIEEVLAKHPEYHLPLTEDDYDPSFVNAFPQLIKMGLPDSDNLFSKMPFAEEDFAQLPNEEYDEHIVFEKEHGNVTSLKITEESVQPNVNCEIIMEKENRCKKEGEFYQIPAIMTVNQLVLFLFEDHEIYNKKFFVVYRDFLRPADLLTKLIELKNQEIEIDELKNKREEKFNEIMVYWAQNFPHDFNQQMIAQLNDIQFEKANEVKSMIVVTRTNFDKFNIILKDHETSQKYFPKTTSEIYPEELPVELFTNKLYLKDISPHFMAQSLAVIHSQLYRAITLDEYARASGPHIDEVMKMFNIEMEWIKQSLFCERILPDTEKQKMSMQKVKEYFMDVWFASHKINDFHACALFATVFSSNDDKAEFMNKKNIEKKDAIMLSNLFKSYNQYYNYRNRVYECLGVATGTPVSFVPFIALVLHDVITVRTGLDDFTEDGKVNFLKFNSIYNIVDEFCLFREKEYSFIPIYQIISMILRGMADVEYLAKGTK